jgi:hypothetical protein
MYRIKVFSAVLLLFGLLAGCSSDTSGPDMNNINGEAFEGSFAKKMIGQEASASYQVTLENLTPATAPGASQPFSPAVLVTHKPPLRLFKWNSYASDELLNIAEDANNQPMLDLLNNSDQVAQVVVGTGVIFPGESETFTIEAKRGMHKLSLVTMLVNTNDGFTGVDKLNLPEEGSTEVYLRAYDAGTERNTELASDIPGPCCGSHFVRVPTHERISYHQGIQGIGDLDPATYGWNEPVAKLTITRLNN